MQQELEHVEQAMHKAYNHTKIAFSKIRTGRVTPSILDGVVVNYYGNDTPISQVAAINTPDAKTLTIKPWEKHYIPEIEKTILNSHLDLIPQNDGEIIRINIPPLTEERRKSLIKQVRNEAEKGRVGVRHARTEAKRAFKDLQNEGTSEDMVKKALKRLQELTDQYIQQIDQMTAHKEVELTKV